MADKDYPRTPELDETLTGIGALVRGDHIRNALYTHDEHMVVTDYDYDVSVDKFRVKVHLESQSPHDAVWTGWLEQDFPVMLITTSRHEPRTLEELFTAAHTQEIPE